MNKLLHILFALLSIITFYCCNDPNKHLSSGSVDTVAFDSLRIHELLNSSYDNCPFNFKLAKSQAEEAFEISEKSKYKTGIATSYEYIGLAYDYQGVYDTAFFYYMKALDLWRELDIKKEIADCLNSVGVSFYYQADYIKAKNYYLEALNIREGQNDLKSVAQSLNNLGIIFRVQEDYKKAISYYNKSINIREKINDVQGIMYAEQNIGFAYQKLNNLDSALYFYTNALLKAEKLNDSLTIASNLINIFEANMKIGDYEVALEKSEEAEKILRILNEKNTLAYCLCSIGELMVELKQYKKAEEYLNEGLILAKQFERKELIQICYQILSNVYSETGKFEEAYKFHKLYASLKDSIIGLENIKQLNELQTKYETLKKEQKIEVLTHEKEAESQRKRVFLALALLLLLLLIVIFLLLNQNKLRSREKEAQLKQKLMRSQMNPHFIFNALGAIQSYIYYNKSDQAVNYLSKFSTLMRDILEASMHDFIPIEQDVSIIENYLSLQKIRHEEKFNFNIKKEIEIGNFQVPPMLTQPFVENSVKHGMEKIEECGLIEVYYQANEEYLIISVVDNGPGFKKTNTKSNHKSYAISLTKQRLDMLGKGSKVIIHSPVTEEGGTEVKIFLPRNMCINDIID